MYHNKWNAEADLNSPVVEQTRCLKKFLYGGMEHEVNLEMLIVNEKAEGSHLAR